MIKIVPISAEVIGPCDTVGNLDKIERMARTCYDSPMSLDPAKNAAFIRKLVDAGHESVIEHVSVSFMLTVPRSISHQIVRHRVGVAYSQQSQRYINLSRAPLEVIAPVPALDPPAFDIWYQATEDAAKAYNALIAEGVEPQRARAVLPNCTATKLGMTANLRAWRHILKERWQNERADPAIRAVMAMVAAELQDLYPPVFGN